VELFTSLIISIHAPERGATDKRYTDAQALKISIHAPERGATESERWRRIESGISIHAPERGATYSGANCCCLRRFQSTPPSGERPAYRSIALDNILFQSTPPSGERPGRDLDDIELSVISIHAPERGAT